MNIRGVLNHADGSQKAALIATGNVLPEAFTVIFAFGKPLFIFMAGVLAGVALALLTIVAAFL